MFKYIQDFIWGPPPNTSNLDSAYDILQSAQETDKVDEPEEEEEDSIQQKYNIEHKVGTITKIAGNCVYELDNAHKFTSEQLFLEGARVSYTLYNDDNNAKVANVVEIVDEWGLDHISTSTAKRTWCVRNTIVQVVQRFGRILHVEPIDIQIDLNKTPSEFIPIVGDFIELETKSEIDEKVVNLNGKILEIIKIRPVRAKMIQGSIRFFNQKLFTGTINKDVFFNKESLLSGYIPKTGDKIVAEIIESNQRNCFWRALKVILQSAAKTNNFTNAINNLPKLTNYEHSADGITISDNIIVTSTKWNESQTFTMTIINQKLEDILLKQITIEGQLAQVKLLSPKHVNQLIITNNTPAEFIFAAVAKSSGNTREVILFHFADIIVGRMIYLKLETASRPVTNEQETTRVKVDQFSNMKIYHQGTETRKAPIRGETVKSAPRFVGRRTHEWKVPKTLVDLYYMHSDHVEFKNNIVTELEKSKLCLVEALSANNYEDRFHTLLYMEEISYDMSMRIYDRERACFVVDPNYLILEMENLAETRPSIIVGDKIIATCMQTDTEYEGFIHKVAGSHIFLKFSSIFHQQYRGEDYGIHVVPSRASFRKLHEAVFMAKLSLSDLLFPNHVLKKNVQVKFKYDSYEDIIDTTHKKMKIRVSDQPAKKSRQDLIHLMKTLNNSTGTPQIGTKLLLEPPEKHFRKKTTHLEFKLEWFDRSLNYYQKEAVRNILLGESRPLPYIIFGPPGTGKTITIIECILQILRMIPHARILVGTPSNSSANLLTSRLIDSGSLKPGDLVRLVSYKAIVENAIPPSVIPYCATASIAKEGTTANENYLTDKGYVSDITTSVLGRHRITIGTCMALGVLQSINFKKGHFTHAIVDEAGQCTEPDIMIPLTHVDTQDGQIIIAGDPMQLGPVVLSPEVKKFGYDETYLDRLINRFPYARDIGGFPNTGGFDPKLVTKLLYNYRSLPELLLIPNSLFYHNALRPTISDKDSEEIDFLRNLSDILPKTVDGGIPSLVFHGIDGVNQKGEDCPSWFNPDEASQVFYYINELYRLGVRKEDVGIITPYIKQVRQIREILTDAEFETPKVGTVEEFQGLEFKVIILSTVRSNAGLVQSDQLHALGFISNSRRFNVALTRSQCLTIIIGNPNLLSTDGNWNLVLTECIKKGSYVGCVY